MRAGSLNRALRGESVALGAAVHMSDPAIVELVALAGFDWVSLTLENSTLGAGDIAQMQRAADLHGLTTLVHAGSLDDPRLLSLLHEGIGGLVLQQAQTRAHAERLVSMTRFAPEGSRGAHAGVRSDRYGTVDYGEAMRAANASFVVGLAIEGETGVENADEMLSVPGVTIAFVGLQDLSHAVGAPNDLGHPRVLEAVAHVVDCGRRHGIPIGLPGYGHSIGELRALGAGLILSPGSEYTFFRELLTAHVERSRAEAREAD